MLRGQFCSAPGSAKIEPVFCEDLFLFLILSRGDLRAMWNLLISFFQLDNTHNKA